MKFRFLLAWGVFAATLLFNLSASAQVSSQLLRAGGVAVMTGDRNVASVVVSNDQAVSIETRGQRSVLVFGKSEGSAEVLLLDSSSRVISREYFEVYADVSALESLVRRVAPDAQVSIARAGNTIVLSGVTADSAEAAMIAELVGGSVAGARVVNLLSAGVDDQFAVSVKVLEVRRSSVEELGLRWQALNRFNEGIASIGSGVSNAVAQSVTAGLFGTARFTVDRLTLDTFIDFLRSEGAAVLLAEPVILATDGERARFLAGGELPVPVPYLNTQGGTSTLGYAYKPYGVTLEFTGRILDGDRVRLTLAPEVSAVDRGQAVEFAGARVPALTTRKVETTVVLNFGESVAIAGLRSTDSSSSRRRLPFSTPFGIGDILAGSRADAENDLELVLIVTPVRGHEAPARIPALVEPIIPGSQ